VLTACKVELGKVKVYMLRAKEDAQ
jgi:hypothetical protein